MSPTNRQRVFFGSNNGSTATMRLQLLQVRSSRRAVRQGMARAMMGSSPRAAAVGGTGAGLDVIKFMKRSAGNAWSACEVGKVEKLWCVTRVSGHVGGVQSQQQAMMMQQQQQQQQRQAQLEIQQHMRRQEHEEALGQKNRRSHAEISYANNSRCSSSGSAAAATTTTADAHT